jgi:voltage-gated potassium channel
MKFLNKYKTVTELPLMALGFIYLALYSVEVLTDQAGLPLLALEAGSEVILWIFVLDLLIRISAHGRRLLTVSGALSFVTENWLALLSVAVPAFRSLRFLRVLIVLRGFAPYLKTRFEHVGFIVSVTLPLVLYVSALSVFEAEKDAEGSNILSFGDAFWWSLVSVTTVGYGDHFPVTPEGKSTAVFLMFVGIGLFSALTALLAAWVLGKDSVKVEQASSSEKA